jgi:DNA-binding NarL/FixJ family response regulator
MSIRLLIVEDTDHVRQMLVEILQLHGFEVGADVGSGHEALGEVDECDPDVVVVDYRMDEMDGVELTRRIRERRPDQQVVIYSAFVDEDVERAAQMAGVAACIPKRNGVEELAREISAVAMQLGGGGDGPPD